jgi:LEA14-like dessication related protein
MSLNNRWPVRSARTAMLALFLSLAGGCSNSQSPQIQVQSATIVQTTDDALVVAFDVLLSNPNSKPLELIEFNYVLHVDDAAVYSGRRDAQTTLPARGQWTLTIPAVVPFSDVPWDIASMPDQARYEMHGTLLYISPGALAEVLMDAGLYRPTTGFGAAGALTLR